MNKSCRGLCPHIPSSSDYLGGAPAPPTEAIRTHAERSQGRGCQAGRGAGVRSIENPLRAMAWYAIPGSWVGEPGQRGDSTEGSTKPGLTWRSTLPADCARKKGYLATWAPKRPQVHTQARAHRPVHPGSEKPPARHRPRSPIGSARPQHRICHTGLHSRDGSLPPARRWLCNAGWS